MTCCSRQARAGVRHTCGADRGGFRSHSRHDRTPYVYPHSCTTLPCYALLYTRLFPPRPSRNALTAPPWVLSFDATDKWRVHYPIEVRFVAGDDVWLSPCFQRPTCYIGVIMYKPYGFNPAYQEYFHEFEQLMVTQFQGRPHWAKPFELKAEDFQHMYAKWDAFQNVRDSCDPKGVFVNDYIKRVLMQEES